jgi:hypothetical protein
VIEKYVSRRIRAEIRVVLLEVWDPIGVGNIPEARDEYDCYLGPVFHLLTEGGTDEQILDYLWKLATEHMGLPATRESMLPTIAALRRISLVDSADPTTSPSED